MPRKAPQKLDSQRANKKAPSHKSKVGEASLIADTAFRRHLSEFIDVSDDLDSFSPKTVQKGLEEIHSEEASMKAKVIAGFNAQHGGSDDPLGTNDITPHPTMGYARYLHLGTMRIWLPKGRIDEGRLQKAQDFLTEEHNGKLIVRWSRVLAYLDFCLENDPEEANTGRNTRLAFFKGCPYHAALTKSASNKENKPADAEAKEKAESSRKMQAAAARKGWEETYSRLTSLWLPTSDATEWEACLDWHDFELFFRDSEAAFSKARSGELPVRKPTGDPKDYRMPQEAPAKQDETQEIDVFSSIEVADEISELTVPRF